MANITPTVNVTPEEQPKYVTDPELLKELNSVGTPQSSTAGYVTDPELLQQLNAPAQPQQPPINLEGKAEAPGDTSIADFLKNYVAKPVVSAVGGEFDPNAPHPFISSAAKGVMNFKSMVNDNFISEIIPLIEDHKKQYGANYEKATPEQRKDFLNSEAELIAHLNKKAQYNKDIQAVTKKYGEGELSKKADDLYSKPEFQNANTLRQFQLYGDLVLSNPKDIPGHIASVSLESLPTSLTSIVAATMASFMKLGPSGAAYAGGATSGLTEFASEYIAMRQEGLSHEEATMKAGVKSTFIGNMDARSFNSAGKALDRIMGQVDKGIVKRVLSTAKETAKELNKQGLYGASGEILGSLASGQKVDPRAALDEYFGELATGPLEALTTYQGKLAEEKAGAEPAPPEPPPGANVPPPGPGTPPPTTGAIIDSSEFDEEDIPGAKPAIPPTTPPPPPATPAAPPEVQDGKTVTDKVQDMIGKELKQATQDEKGQQILDDLDSKGIAPKSVAEQFWNDTFFKLPAPTQQYFKNYLKKITGMEPGSVLAVDGEGNDLIAKDWVDLGKYHAVDLGDRVDYLEGTDRGYVALLDEANRRFENAQVSSPEPAAIAQEPVIKSKKQADAEEAAARALQEEERIKATKEVMKRTYGARPIEDKAIEAEAKSIVAELEQYNPAFASGAKNAVDQGRIQTTEDLHFYRRRLAEYKAQAGAGKSPVKETYNSMTFFQDDPAVLKLREQALESAPQPIKDKIAKADALLQKIADKINSEGYSINEPNAPQNIKNLQTRASNIGADVSQVLKKSEQIQKGRKIASPEKLAQKEAMLDESIADATKDVEPKAEQTIPMARKGTYEYAARLLDSSLKNNEITRDDYNNIGWFLRNPSSPIKDTIKKINDKEPTKLAQKEAEPEVALPERSSKK
jgi:hypothetical protein